MFLSQRKILRILRRCLSICPTKTITRKRGPFEVAPYVNRLHMKSEKIVFKTESRNDYHHSYRNSFRTGNTYKFSERNLAQKIFPRTDCTGKVRKTSRDFGNCDRVHITNIIKTFAKACSNQKKKKDFTDRISHDRKKVEGLLSKGAIPSVNQLEDQFLRTFLVPKKDVNQRPVISSNKRQLNQFIPCQHFKTDCLHSLKEVLPARRGLYVQAGFEGCLFLCPI